MGQRKREDVYLKMSMIQINSFDVLITRTMRKRSISIQITSDGVKVLAPRFVSVKSIKSAVMEKADWIEKN